MEEFYLKQSGNGFTIYSGTKYQRGYGWFGRVINRTVLPFLRYIGTKALKTGTNILNDFGNGENIIDSMRKRAAETVSDIGGDIAQKLRQAGKGIKRMRVQRNIGKHIKEVKIPVCKKPRYNFLK